ncbi:frizzled/Smoothened family membrane region domain-containing protein [Ditylenchus destructor]|nr:frizzled/Smoothened family membrane region domain-containing protein [Ditylenchus destructor]
MWRSLTNPLLSSHNPESSQPKPHRTSNTRQISNPLALLLLLFCISHTILQINAHRADAGLLDSYSTGSKKKRCEPITIPLCQGIGYNMTSYPNSYGHERQEEAGLEVHQFYPLVEVGCYKHLKFFLCSMYTPLCQDNYDLAVMPCREVCIEARKNCAPLMQQYGFKWPATLACDQLPRKSEQETTGQICAAPPDIPENPKPDSTSNEIMAGKKSSSGRAKSKNKPQSSVVPPEMVGIDVVDEQCQCRCVLPFQVTTHRTGHIHNVSNCGYTCRAEAVETKMDANFLNTWISIWSGICLALSIFTVLTFLTDMGRFPYPERPIFFLSICQMMVSIGFLLRVIYGHESVGCDGTGLLWNFMTSVLPNHATNPATSVPSNSPSLCMFSFILIYFFGMAASTWWVVLTLSWVLAAVPHWSTEWIAKYSTYFHWFAWMLPALQTIVVYVFGAVDGDPVLGICYVGNTNVTNLRVFVLAPLVIYFTVGVLFLSVGFLNLWGIRSNLKKTHPGVDKTSKLTQLMSKIGVFSVLYTVPAVFVILVLFYEQYYRPIWEQARLCPCAPQIPQNNNTVFLLALIKSASMLVVGWTSGVWIVSAKTLQSWRRTFCCCFCCCVDDETANIRQGYYPANNGRYHQDDIIVHNHPGTLQYGNEHHSLNRPYHQLIGHGPVVSMNGSMHYATSNGKGGYGITVPAGDIIYTAKPRGNHTDTSMSSPMTYATNGTMRPQQAVLPENV